MKLELFAKSILLALVVILTGCDSKESSEDELSAPKAIALWYNVKAPIRIIEKEAMPVWLSEFIDFHVTDKTSGILDFAVFQGKWKGKVIYYVSNSLSSCLMCDTFWADGDIVDWSVNDIQNFLKSSTDWKCIYLHKIKYSHTFPDL